MLGSGFLVVHDALSRRQHAESELAGGEDRVDGVLELSDFEVEARADSALVDSSVQLNHDLSSTLVVDNLEVVDVA